MENAGFYLLAAFAIATGFYAVYHRNYLMVIGAVVAALAHAGLLFGDRIPGMRWNSDPPAPPPVLRLEGPPPLPEQLKPDEPDPVPVESEHLPPVKIEVAPPTTPDAPALARGNGFLQRLVAPVPDAVIGTNLTTIPPGRATPGRGGPITVGISELKVKPRPTYQVEPVYPPDLKREGLSGTVVLGFIVDAGGTARDIQVLSADHPGFIPAAVAALQKWRFSPGRDRGRPVHTRNVQQSIRFNLNES